MSAAKLIGLALQVSIVLLVFCVGLNAAFGDVRWLLRRPGLLARSLLAMNVILPVVAACIAVGLGLPGATTLAQGGMLAAVSNIDVGAGTSTSYTPFNLNLNNPTAASCSAAHTYTGNGTDPLTAGNHLDLQRVSAVIDADAATSGIIPPTLSWSAKDKVAPLITQVGSILAYGEAAANTLFATILWAEFNHSDFA